MTNPKQEKLLEAYSAGYRISSDGTILSPYSPTPISGYVSPRGYRCFKLNRNYPILVHRLHAYQLYGDAVFIPGTVVRHLNGDKLDNSPTNLALGTQSDNSYDIPEEVRRKTGKHAASFLRKLTEEQVASLRADRAAGLSYAYLTKKYGIASSTVSDIVHYKTYPV